MRFSAIRILGLSMLIAFSLLSWDLWASQQSPESQPPSAPMEQTAEEPNLSEIIPLSAKLATRLAELEKKIQGLPDLAPIEKKYSAIEISIDEIAQQFKGLKDAQEVYARHFTLKQSLVNEKGLLEITGKPLADEKKRWQNWHSSLLKERSSGQLRSAFERALLTINKAQDLVSQRLEPLMALQARGAEIKSRIDSLDAEVTTLIAETRQDSLLGKFPPMYSGLYFAQFRIELWNATRDGLRLLSWPGSRFFVLHGLFYPLLLLLFIITSVVIHRNRQALKESEHWRFVAAKPVSTAFFICALITAFQLELWAAPSTVILINTIIGGIACVRLLGSVLEQPWRKRAAYGFMTGYVITVILIAAGLPSPLFRLYIFVASFAALRFCLRWTRESAGLNEPPCYAWSLRMIALLFGVILLAEFLGKAGVAAYLFEALLTTVAIVLPIRPRWRLFCPSPSSST